MMEDRKTQEVGNRLYQKGHEKARKMTEEEYYKKHLAEQHA